MYLLVGFCAAIGLIFIYKFFGESSVSLSAEKPIKVKMETIQELIKTMNKLMDEAGIDKAKFSEYLKSNNINPLKL